MAPPYPKHTLHLPATITEAQAGGDGKFGKSSKCKPGTTSSGLNLPQKGTLQKLSLGGVWLKSSLIARHFDNNKT